MRFVSFQDGWIRYKNCDLFSYRLERKREQNLPIASASQEKGMIIRSENGIDIKYEESSTVNYKVVHDGDYVVHLRSFQGGFAFSNFKCACSPAYIVLKPNDKLCYSFLKEYFMSNKFINSLKDVTYGIRDGRTISHDEWMRKYSTIPSIKEQNKIVSFLQLIDRRIEAQNKIIDKCKSLIKCICDSAEMNSNKQLKDIANYNSSIIKESAVGSKGKYPVFGAAGICGYLDDYVFSKAGIAIVKDGAGVGRLLKIKNDKYSILGTMGLIETKNGISQDYLWLSLKKIKFEKYVVGSGIPHIYFSDYSSAQIPSFTDKNFSRAKLCDLLLEKIKIDEDILAKYLKQKGFLLNNLFI